MLKKEKFLIAEYRNALLKRQDAVLVRGFFADMNEEDPYLHNHLKSGKDVYQYPRVQYKVIHNHPVILACKEGIDSIYPQLMRADTLILGEHTYDDPDLQIYLLTRPVGDSKQDQQYSFLTPWLALNQDNYRKYMELTGEDEKEALLSSILIGNILSMCKAFDVILEQHVHTDICVRPVPVRFKDEPMIGFVGKFRANVKIPTLCGLGKGVSVGMGTVKAEKPDEVTEDLR